MSDRYETPRWDDEPEDLLAGETRAADDPVSADESDLDVSSENVLDGWPAADPTSLVADDEPSVDDEPRCQRGAGCR